MISSASSRLLASGLVAAVGFACGASAQSTAIGLARSGDRLVTFAPGNVSTLLSNVPISGLASGETITNIDARPRTGEIFGISSLNNMYILNPTTGAAQLRFVAGATAFVINDAAGMDFNPVPDRIRITTASGRNLRLNPDTGGQVADDSAVNGNLRFVAGDANFGATPRIISVGYVNSTFGVFPTGLPSTMFGVNILQPAGGSKSYQLVRVGSVDGTPDSPNNGNVSTIGGISGLFSDDFFGFDIFRSGNVDTAYLSGNPLIGGSAFYTLDLATGSNTFQGNVGGGTPVNLRDFTVIPAPGAAALLGMGVMVVRRRRA